jgi:hypothetical protein
MRQFTFTVALAAAVACAQPPPSATAPPAAVTPFPSGTLVDLSHTYDRTTVFWPTADAFRLDVVADGDTPAGYYYAANNFFSSSTAARTWTRRSISRAARSRWIRCRSIACSARPTWWT